MNRFGTPAGAKFSACRRWRYVLWRRWDESAPLANFLMLNPSTADERRLDPTCARARSYAERWGYGGVIVTNLFGWRATDPARLLEAREPVGEANDRAILAAARCAGLVVCAWGNLGSHRDRGAQVEQALRKRGIELHVLRVNADGQPAHPLYLPGSLDPERWAGKTGQGCELRNCGKSDCGKACGKAGLRR